MIRATNAGLAAAAPGCRSRLALAACGATLLAALGAGAQDGAAGGDEGGDRADSAPRLPPIGIDGIELEELERGEAPVVERFILPPYYQEVAGPVTFRTLFPFYFERQRTGEGARSDLGVMPFYWRYREGPASADVYFPLYWRFREPRFDTDIVLQTYLNRGEYGHDFGFAPLLFLGENEVTGSDYQVVPPLFWRFAGKDDLFLLAGAYYHHRDGEDYDLGLPPIFFAGKERDDSYLVVLPPLFWHFRDDLNYETTSVLPPLFFRTRETGWSAGLLPLLYLARDENWARTLVTPFYYGSRWGRGRSHYLPPLLSYYRHSPTLSQGGVAAFYHWYEEEGDFMRMYSPLLWTWGNDRTDDRAWLVPPLLYRHDSPVADDTMVGLVYWNFHEHHQERTFALMPLFAHHKKLYEDNWRMWLAPTFDFGLNPDGGHFWLHPLFYVGREKQDSHLVLAPILWHFADPEERSTVVFPLWWNFRKLERQRLSRVAFPLWWQFDDERRDNHKRVLFPVWWDFVNSKKDERTLLLAPLFWRDRDPRRSVSGFLNIIWNEGALKENRFWTFQLFPLIGCGHPPVPEGEGAYWSFLMGLAGWRRQGSTKELKLFWIPFDVSDD